MNTVVVPLQGNLALATTVAAQLGVTLGELTVHTTILTCACVMRNVWMARWMICSTGTHQGVKRERAAAKKAKIFT